LPSLILIRHGQSEHHINGLTGGWTDTPLTERGRQQVALLAGRLKQVMAGIPARLVSSDLVRSVQTAEIVGQALGLPVARHPGLREINNGIAAGMRREEAHPLRTPPTEPLLDWRPFPGGETWREFYTRVAACMEELTREQEELLVVVSHGGTIIQQVGWWLRMGIETLGHSWFDIHPASLSVLRLNKWGDRTVERLNDTAHLYTAGLGEGVMLGEA
jgi:broad specificity phosphatase PhoE